MPVRCGRRHRFEVSKFHENRGLVTARPIPAIPDSHRVASRTSASPKCYRQWRSGSKLQQRRPLAGRHFTYDAVDRL